MNLFKYEFKRALKKPITFLLIALIIFLGVNVYTEMSFFNSKIKYNREIPYSYFTVGEDRNIMESVREFSLKDQKYNEVNMLDNLLKYAENAVDSYEKGNYKEAYKNDLIANMMNMRLFCSIDESDLLKSNIIDIWNEILPEIEYDTFKVSNLETKITVDEIKSYCVKIKYRYDLFNKDIRYIDNYSLNNVTFIYNMIDKILPIIICVAVVLISFNSISDEYRLGITKNISTQPFKRSKYYITMVLANFLAIFLIVVVTVGILSLFVGAASEFHSFDTPILTHNNQWNTLNIKGMDLKEAYNVTLQKSYLGPVEISYNDLSKNLFSNVAFISFRKFLIQALSLFFVYTFLLTTISVFVSSIFKDKIKSLIVLIVINAIGYISSYFYPSIFNIFSMGNATKIITGSINFTLLGSFIVLFIDILISILISTNYLKRKDITG
ncbi:ABC transporter permease subunit [Clostridium sp.]|uniref:ABC transporter permease subunit n=1 Tax=Clostridium sp. TaxID=1506 RepID=UPI003216F8D8